MSDTKELIARFRKLAIFDPDFDRAANLIEQQAKELSKANIGVNVLQGQLNIARGELAECQARVVVLETAAKDAPAILKHMIRTSEKACPPMHYLLTHDGLYGFHMANLLVRNDGKEYVMEADWADNCGKLVKHLTEALAPTDTAAIVQKWREQHYEECAVICDQFKHEQEVCSKQSVRTERGKQLAQDSASAAYICAETIRRAAIRAAAKAN